VLVVLVATAYAYLAHVVVMLRYSSECCKLSAQSWFGFQEMIVRYSSRCSVICHNHALDGLGVRLASEANQHPIRSYENLDIDGLPKLQAKHENNCRVMPDEFVSPPTEKDIVNLGNSQQTTKREAKSNSPVLSKEVAPSSSKQGPLY
jgi:hypothetical protein